MYQSASIYHFIIPALNSDLQDSDLECSTKIIILNLSQLRFCSSVQFRGGSRISVKGVHMYKCVEFALLILSHLS